MAEAHGASAARDLPFWTTSRSRRTGNEDRAPSPDQKSFHISTTLTTQGRKRRPPGSIQPRTLWKSHPHWLIADWLELMESAPGESCPSGQRRGPSAPREDEVPSPDQNSFHISTSPTTRGRKQRSHRTISPRTVRKPQPHWLISVGLVLMGSARGESFLSDQRRGPAE